MFLFHVILFLKYFYFLKLRIALPRSINACCKCWACFWWACWLSICCCSLSAINSFATRLLACWLRSDMTFTLIPDATCVAWTAESVVLTCWPPAPEARQAWKVMVSSGGSCNGVSNGRCLQTSFYVYVVDELGFEKSIELYQAKFWAMFGHPHRHLEVQMNNHVESHGFQLFGDGSFLFLLLCVFLQAYILQRVDILRVQAQHWVGQ